MPVLLVGGGGAKNGYFWPFGAKNRDFLAIWGQKQGVLGFLVGGQKFEFLAIYSPVEDYTFTI